MRRPITVHNCILQLRHSENGRMTLIQDVRRLGGFALTTDLRELGHSARSIGLAVSRSDLLRPRLGWVVLPTLDPQLHFAVKHGVLLTCVTQARRQGIWVSDEPDVPHVAARNTGRHIAAPARVPWAQPVVPRSPTALEDEIPNMLCHIAECLPFEHALASWESAVRQGKTDLELLGALRLPSRSRLVLQHCTPFADSGLETLFRTRLRWLRLPIRAQISIHGHRVDYLVGDRLIVQIDGKQHAGAQKAADNSHDAELQARGYHIIRVIYAQVMHDWPRVQHEIQLAIAAGLHLRRMDQRSRRAS